MCAWLQLEGVEPLASPDDCLLAEQIAKEDPKVREMLKARGVTDIDLVACDPWSGTHCPYPRLGQMGHQLFGSVYPPVCLLLTGVAVDTGCAACPAQSCTVFDWVC